MRLKAEKRTGQINWAIKGTKTGKHEGITAKAKRKEV